jgi:uncharacterized protein YdeI (YjbR/CyaY-like superfamily)
MKSKQNTVDEIPVMEFKRQQDWASWLDKNHAASSGVWLKFARKASGLTTISHPEALEVALCYGWIDGQNKSHDESSWMQKFLPRGKKSIWSKINREKALELIDTGRMKPAGLQAVELAKSDGRWDAAYDPASSAAVPDDLQAELDKHPKAKDFFATVRIRTFKLKGFTSRRPMESGANRVRP